MTQKAYCEQNGLTPFGLSYWKKKLAAGDEGPLVEVTPVQRTRTVVNLFELRLTDELDLSLSFRLPGAMLRSLFQ